MSRWQATGWRLAPFIRRYRFVLGIVAAVPLSILIVGTIFLRTGLRAR